MPRKTRASSKRNLDAREKSQQAVRLRQSGATILQIATQLGYANESGAYKAIMRELQVTALEHSESTESLRQLEVERLDRMLRATWPLVLSGDQAAINTALRIEESRRNLLGIDAPKQFEAKIRIDLMSWNQALKDMLDIYREVHGNPPEADRFIVKIDELAQSRFGSYAN